MDLEPSSNVTFVDFKNKKILSEESTEEKEISTISEERALEIILERADKLDW